MNHFSALITALLALILLTDCKNQAEVPGECIKGKYLGQQCNGAIIQLLDKRVKGKDWKGVNGQLYRNCLVASVSPTVFDPIHNPDPLYSKSGSVFYFKFSEGGDPMLQFVLCEPTAFVTITSTSPTPCL